MLILGLEKTRTDLSKVMHIAEVVRELMRERGLSFVDCPDTIPLPSGSLLRPAKHNNSGDVV